MARAFSAKEAKMLIQQHRIWLDQLLKNRNCANKHSEEAVSVMRNLAGRGVFSKYVADELISGTIRRELPTDIQQMIYCLYKYRQSKSLADESERLYQENWHQIDAEIYRLRVGTNGVQWFFASQRNKDKAEHAYVFLDTAAKGTYAWQVNAVTRDVGRLQKEGHSEAISVFEKSRDSFERTLCDVMPNEIKQASPIPEIVRIVDAHQALLKQLRTVETVVAQIRERIENTSERVIASEVLSVLRKSSVDELSRRIGNRWKLLQEAGYATIADVLCATAHNLSSISGISGDAASTIKNYVNWYATQTKGDAKIRLSVDSKSEETTQLVLAIYECRQRAATIDALDEIQQTYDGDISNCMQSLTEIGNGTRWIFFEEQKKQTAINAYRYLSNLLNGEYARRVRELLGELEHTLFIDPQEAWADFAKNSIAYYNILETLVPGVLGNDDEQFGLPEELAREIQEEDFFPDGLKCELRRYQLWGVKYILHQERVLLGDEMGLGKTVQAIAAMVSLRNTGATHFMVICPASVIPNWCKEVRQKSKLRVTKIHGQERLHAFQSWIKHGGVAITNYETTRLLKMEENFSFDMMIVDEAHYIKNTETERTKNVHRIGTHTKRLLFMTGTALENKVDEMISLVRVLQPTIAAQLHKIAFMSTAPQFRKKVAPVYYRRKREDVLTELPELIESQEWCTMTPEEEAIYEHTVLNEHYTHVRRVSWNVDDLCNSSKARRMKEIIEDAKSEGRKILVFSFFLDTIDQIQKFLGSQCLPPIKGSLSPQRRQEIIDRFDRASAGSVLLAQIQSGGTGLNIQSASVVIMCEPQLKPSIENQAISRAYRMGQTRNVLVYRLLCEETIDERLTELLAEKQAIFDAFADKSVSADATAQEAFTVDDKAMSKIIKEEIDRINAKKIRQIS